MGRIFLGIIMTIIGFMMAWKTEALISFTGLSGWAEDKMRTMGGTRLMYKLIGIGMIFAGMLAITNMHQGFLQGTIGKLFNPKI